VAQGYKVSATTDLSPRLAAIVEALPLRPGLRVLEIGCGPGAAARAVARRIGDVHWDDDLTITYRRRV
jgi:protein-L-isoaspartate O-methyltransferase